MGRTIAVALALPALAGAAEAQDVGLARDPLPIHGIALPPDTGLRLAVSAKRPFVLDVDAGTVRSIPLVQRGIVTVVGVGGRAAVVVAKPFSRRGQLYAMRGQTASLKPLGRGSEVAPASDGQSVWVKRVIRSSRCTLRQVRLDGRVLRSPKAFRCGWTIYPGGSLGLGVSPVRVIDPVTRRTVFKTRLSIVAVAERTVVLRGGPGNPLTLFDTATGARRRLAWPDTSGQLETFRTAVDVRGRFVALSFGNPSWTSEGRYPDDQYYDAWVLDTRTAELTRLPSMPAFVALKWTSTAWTQDGRLVLLARSGGKDVVAVWRPGQESLGVKSMRLRARDNIASNAFAPLG